jgi:hypothetical protein
MSSTVNLLSCGRLALVRFYKFVCFSLITNFCFAIIMLLPAHVKIREHKAVCLKCDVCSDLSAARRKFKDQHERVYIRDLHAGHRSAYMGSA